MTVESMLAEVWAQIKEQVKNTSVSINLKIGTLIIKQHGHT
jgi:hypothetical protein